MPSHHRIGHQRLALIAAAALLAAGFGFCVLPGHHGDYGTHGHSPELCASLVVLLVAVTPLSKPVLSGRSVPAARHAFPPLRVTPTERPPEHALPA
jgi:hypothetical protein